jgi:hypothetical protein
MNCNNCAVPAVPEGISLISNEEEDDTKKKRAVPAPVPEVILLVSSDNESEDEIPESQYMVGKVASYMTPPPPRVTGLPRRAPPLHATGAVGDIGDPDSFWIDPTDPAQIEYDPSTSTAVMFLFTVQGKPRPLKTARFRTNGWSVPMEKNL